VIAPTPASRFVGRIPELARIALAFDAGARLITLLGPPGVGKTRLALEHASSRSPAPRAVCFCPLETARTEADVCFALRRALGAELDPPRTEDEPLRIAELLVARGVELVVLDGLEHLLHLAPSTVRRWVEHASATRFLVTSRVRLAIDGEELLEIGPLALPSRVDEVEQSEASVLLLDRARALGREVASDDTARRHVLELVRLLDGLPLAIELAAARLRVLGLAQLVTQVERHRLDVLGGAEPRRSDGRHGTLREALAWSWDLLGAAERSALAQCAVFAGGFDLGAAADVIVGVSGSRPVLDVVQSLCDQSLLRLEAARGDEAPRFVMLESVREFVRERATSEELAGASQRHAEHYLARFRGAASEDVSRSPAAPRALAAEVDNLVAIHRRARDEPDASPHAAPSPEAAARAVRAALALTPLLDLRGPGALPTSLLDSALEAARQPGIAVAWHAQLLGARADAHRWAGRIDEAERDLREAAALDGVPPLVAGRIRHRAASLALVRGMVPLAEEHYTAALHAAEQHDDPGLAAIASYGLALVAHDRGELAQAARRYEDARALARRIGDRRLEGLTLSSLATLQMAEARADEARALSEAARIAHADAGDLRSEGHTLVGLACLEIAAGRPDRAREPLARALDIQRDLLNARYEAIALETLAIVDILLADHSRARQSLARVREIQSRYGNARETALAGVYEAWILAREGRFDAARDAFAEASRDLDGAWLAPARIHEGHLDLALARAALRDGRPADLERSIAAARARVGAPPFASALAWLASKILERAIDGLESARTGLLVAADGHWFQPPRGPRVALGNRATLARILARLARERQGAPGRALSTFDLVEAGWPNERMAARSATGRVHVAVATLRRLGLAKVLMRREDGYLLDPTVITTRLDAGASAPV
jgi:predicted ATPase